MCIQKRHKIVRECVAAAAAVLALLGATATAHARTKLVALPDRDRLVLSLQHPVMSLVTEERVLTLQKGVNSIDFSWQGVMIDPGSIQIQMLDHPGEEKGATLVLSVSYPPNENALTWDIASPEARTERVRILYLLSGFPRLDSYEATVDAAEKTALVRGYFRLSNTSGEDLESALIRRGFAEEWTKGLRDRETKQMLAFTNDKLPVKKLYVCSPNPMSRSGDDGERIRLVYELVNDEASGFGRFKLPAGKARIFQTDAAGSTVFLGEDNLDETPVKEERELSLGVVKDVTVKRFIMDDDQINIKYNTSRQIALYDRRVHVRYELQNFKTNPVTLKIVERLGDCWEFEELDSDGVRSEIKNNSELNIYVDLAARPKDEKAEVPKREVNFTFVVRNQIPNRPDQMWQPGQ